MTKSLPSDRPLAEKYEVEDLDTGKVLGTFPSDGHFDVEVPVRGIKIFKLTPSD